MKPTKSITEMAVFGRGSSRTVKKKTVCINLESLGLGVVAVDLTFDVNRNGDAVLLGGPLRPAVFRQTHLDLSED